MNDEKITIIPFQLKEEKEEKKEESDEEYEVIKESYHSSPKYGTKSKIVKKVNNNITFSPVETSIKPYLKYCVVQIKEEQKNDISQEETTQTKLNDEKSKANNLTNYSNNNELRTSLQFKDEKFEGSQCICTKEENKEERERESEYNYVHIVEKKSSEITLNIAYKCNEENKKLEKEKNSKNRNILAYESSTPKTYHHSLRSKEDSKLKIKLHLNNEDEEKKQKLKHSQRNIYNMLNNIPVQESIHSDKFNNIRLLNKMKIEENKDITKVKSIFNLNSISLKKEKDKKASPRNKDKNNPIKVTSSFTTNNIKRLKKSKKKDEKEKENDNKKSRRHVLRQHSYIPESKEKKYKINHNEDKDNNTNKRRRRHSLIPNVDMKKQDKNLFNIFINNAKEEKDKEKEKKNLKKIKSKHQKMKSLGEGNENINFLELLKNEKNKRCEKEKEKDKDKDNGCSLKRKQNNCNNNKNKVEDTFKDVENNNIKAHDFSKTSKSKRKVSVFENNDNKRRKRMHTEEKKDAMKKKSTFSGIKEKEKNNNKEKKTKNKKGKKNKKIKKENTNHQTHSVKKVMRKDKSFTLGSKTKLMNDDNNQNDNSFDSSKSNINDNQIKHTPSKTSKKLNTNNPNENSQNDIRRNSTRDLFRDTNRKEKITALTNYQNIENINDYTKKCLQIIPDLYELGDKMPRCKQKIHPNLIGNKKIALFDLDETIVHCIGEINMNNVESFSMQCDAKIKVELPAGRKVATIGINIRPHWKEALEKIKSKYHIIAFTASHDSYADSVLNFLDPKNKYFEYRLYRKNCVLCDINEMKFYVKDLKIIEDAYDLKDVVVIDNSVLSFAYHLDNGIPISPFYDSKTDTELLDIADFLVEYADENDIRDKLKEVYKLNQYMEILKDYISEESEESSESLGDEEDNKDGNTTKNCPLNKNRTNINLNKPLLVDNTKKSDDENENENRFDNTSNKNISQVNLKLKEITKLFNDNDNDTINETKEAKSDKKLHTPKLNGIQKENRSIHKSIISPERNYVRKKRGKQRTFRFGINFKKEWEEKQKELKNKQ